MDTVAKIIHCSRAEGPATPKSSWRDLRNRFLDACSETDGESPGRWLDMWYLLLAHPWYQEQLASAARSILRSNRCPFQWQADIEQEAIVRLARRMKKMPSLGIDPAQAKQHFAGWMRTIITHDCRDGLRKLCRESRHSLPLPDSFPASEDRVQKETRVDLAVALDQLGEQESAVLLLYSKGFTLRQVGEILDLSFWRTYRAYHSGLERLRQLL